MRTIYKYPLEIKDKQIIKVKGIKENWAIQNHLLQVGVQKNIPCLWCLADDGEPTRDIEITMIGTGNRVEPNWLDKSNHLGTVMLYGGDLVMHIFVTQNQY